MRALVSYFPAMTRQAARCLAMLLSLLMALAPVEAQSSSDSGATATHASSSSSKSGSSTKKKTKKPASKAPAHKPSSQASRAARAARTARMHQAFVASTELRPMAQQLALLRTPEAYAGVTAYARRHGGSAAAAAYLALGHAYLLDKRYAEAETNLRLARQDGPELADYAEFFGAEASHAAGDDAAAATLLRGFAARYPDSIFAARAPELEASVLLALGNPSGARQALTQAQGTEAVNRTGYQLAAAQVELALGQRQAAASAFRSLLLGHPLSQEAQIARARLTELGTETSLSVADLRRLAEAYYNAGRYTEADEQYRALLRLPALSAPERNGFTVAEAACQLKLKRLTAAEAEALPDTADDNGARRLDLMMELARSRDDETAQQRIVAEMENRFPQSQWLAEALFSSGNMYLLKRDYPRAVEYYSYLAMQFPGAKNAAAAHWRAGWLSYRQGQYAAAARLFDEQIRLYPGATETVAATYWRGRLYETMEHDPGRAAANYRTIVRAYPHFFYGQMARARLAALGHTQPADEPQSGHVHALPRPMPVESFPSDSPHLAKARLLVNAGLSEYVSQEIAADPDAASWSALAEAQIYASYGETFRALRAGKRALPYAASAPIRSIPLAYWRILFPEPWWSTIQAEAAKNNLDPYLLASLIRQESEFNPAAVSYANAYGLMQLLPSVGRAMAREEGNRRFQTFHLLDPETNIRLGARYLRHMLDRFGGVQEYALAAYNAGDSRVADWQAAGPYRGMDEFVESIPFTQTREYVEAILRNEEIYREIDAYEHAQRGAPAARN